MCVFRLSESSSQSRTVKFFFAERANMFILSPDVATLGERIRDCRQARGWTVEELAARAKVSKGFLSDLERSKQKNPGINYLRPIAGALDVSLHYLTTGRSGPPSATEVQLPASLVEF